MTDITIPPEALEASAKDLYERTHPNLKWENCASELGEIFRRAYLCRVRTACLAMLKAWPGMSRGYNDHGKQWEALSDFHSQPTDGFILPLTENTNE